MDDSIDYYNKAVEQVRRFKRNMKYVRRWNLISQKDLAEKCMISQGMISGYETGRAHPSLANAMTICNALGVDISDMMTKKAYRDGWV